jgi:hypothetical protein
MRPYRLWWVRALSDQAGYHGFPAYVDRRSLATSRRVYESMLDELSRSDVDNLATLLEKSLKRLDHLSVLRRLCATIGGPTCPGGGLGGVIAVDALRAIFGTSSSRRAAFRHASGVMGGGE